MLRRVLHALTALSLTGIALIGCNRAAGQGTVSTDPIRNEREPGETTDYHSAVPDSTGGGIDVSGGSTTETEIEIEEDSASSDSTTDSKDADKSEETSDSESSDDDGESGGEIEIEIEP